MKKEYDICIIGGCGHVGLPLGLAFADKGKNVALFDINKKSIDKVNKGEMPFTEEGADELLPKVIKSKKLLATDSVDAIRKSEVLIMVIGTPVDEHLNPKLRDVIDAIKQIEDYLDDGHLLVLRSTLFPGVSEKIHQYLYDNGKSVDVAFCPERITEGHALTELYDLPQIISGCRPSAATRAANLFTLLTKDIIELSPTEAELAKLYTNTWRYINFAISNQFYMIANDHNLDFYKIHDAMVKDYPRLKAFAKAGFAAGPCLFKDTMQLSAFSTNNFFLGHAAMLVNEGLPDYIVEQLKRTTDLSKKTVGILGMSFKAESDDPRESLSYKLKKRLEIEAKDVLCTDAHMNDSSLVSTEELLKKADIIIVAAPHKEYKNLNLTGLKVVDIWNLYNKGGMIV
ncbi:MAG TPA: nucleotide sugar dehydrogenase [Candidatus Saccharibacteria bacterium]|nr:nucleotide sugar dehydrogenase [Candidatus Saccharibacteria bacterium]